MSMEMKWRMDLFVGAFSLSVKRWMTEEEECIYIINHSLSDRMTSDCVHQRDVEEE